MLIFFIGQNFWNQKNSESCYSRSCHKWLTERLAYSGALNNEHTLLKNWILLVGLLVEDGNSEGQDPGPDLAGEVGVGPPPRQLPVEPDEPGFHLLPIGQPANTF